MKTTSHSFLEPFGLTPIDRVRKAIEAIRAGRPALVLDDDDRENEADLIIAADTIDDEVMAMMIRNGSGIVCLCLTRERVEELALPQMVVDNSAVNQTAFTVSIEAKTGVTTGVSAADRVRTIKVAVADHTTAADLARPGHVFPLRAADRGLFERRGHTEATIELARLAGFRPAGVLCELMNDDGTMARGDEVERFAVENRLPVLCIQDIVDYLTLAADSSVSDREVEVGHFPPARPAAQA